ncbi:MAG: SufD family Fe-S cluster assembly protein, partial [Thermoplasmata archaeon]
MAAAAHPFTSWLTAGQLHDLSDRLGEPEPVRRAREAARDAFEALPLEPNPLYRGYSNIAGADLTGLEVALEGPAVAVPPAPPHTLRIVHDASGTRAEVPVELTRVGVTVNTLPEILSEPDGSGAKLIAPVLSEDKLTAFARALVNRAVRVTVPDGCPLPIRIEDLALLSEPRQSLSVHREIRAGRGSRVLLAEQLFSTGEDAALGARMYASTVSIEVGEEAAVHHLSVHAPDPQAVSFYARRGRVGRSGQLVWVWTGFGGYRTRLRNLSELPGAGSRVEDLQTFYGRDDQAYDSSVQISHIGTDTHGQSVTRGVFKDRSQGVSRGLV